MAELTIRPDSEDLGIKNNIQSFRSSLNGFRQFGELPGSIWILAMTWTNRYNATDNQLQANRLKAFLTSLNGPTGTFTYTPTEAQTRQGTGLGSGVMNGANQQGESLVTDGWTINQTDLLKAGDYIEVNQELKMVVEDVASDGSGNATIKIRPAIRKPPADGAQIIVDQPKGVFRMNASTQGWALTAPEFYAFSANFSEVI
tara:strand:- start:2762 stop:3364 length:603 start_codon:yes stop_codon:yes gene_type:complete